MHAIPLALDAAMTRAAAISLNQAMEQSPALARLSTLVAQSRAQWDAVAPLLPPALQKCVAPGPLDGTTWCLLVSNNSAAAKLRQFGPALRQRLAERGWEISAIRVKIQT